MILYHIDAKDLYLLMSIYGIKLDANDDVVVTYLNKLWESKTVTVNNRPVINKHPLEQELAESPNKKIKVEQHPDQLETKKVVINNPTINNLDPNSIKKSLYELRRIGFWIYNGQRFESELNLNPKKVTTNDIKTVIAFNNNQLIRANLLKNISRCVIIPKYKSNGSPTDPKNFRYLINHHNVIKIIDRLWCRHVVTKIGDNKPDPTIYTASILTNQVLSGNLSIQNTLSYDSVVLLDIQKAFDSLEWYVIQELLIANLSRKIGCEEAINLVNCYLTIIKNRKVYYNNKLVNIQKGVPTGLPSSGLIFTLCMEEIIYRWMNSTSTVFGPREKYVNNKDFVLNVYVDDIYIKILNKQKTFEIVYSLIDELNKYNLFVNYPKCKADESLMFLNFDKIKPTDFYLGIPFTRDIKLYKKLILNDFNKRNNYNDSWSDIYYRIQYHDTDSRLYQSTYGFMIYKLKPLMISNEMNRENMCEFIKDNFFNWFEYIMYLIYYYFGFLMIYKKNF